MCDLASKETTGRRRGNGVAASHLYEVHSSKYGEKTKGITICVAKQSSVADDV